MPEPQRCPNGHSWESNEDFISSEQDLARACPQCAAMALTVTGDALPPSPESLLPFTPSATGDSYQPLPHIPGYEILENLGPGGMGVVFKARQLMPPRLVALKMIKEGLFASPALRLRFRREVEAVARLQHPNIVPIYQFGEHDGRPFFTMELMEGGTLQQKLAGVPQSAPESARLVEILARAIHAAHLQNVIHRDLKPSNILLGGGPLGACVAKIADFGLAKIVEGPADLTPTQAVLGTVGYMPPEQAGGKSSTIGPRADVYSVGAILYQMLTGQPPFHGDSTIEVLLQVVREEPVAPRRLRASVPIDLETICLACLEKDPSKRYASALELAEDLRRFQAHEPIKRRPVGPLGRFTRWSRRNPALAFAGGLTVVALLTVTILSVIFGVTQAQSNRELDERRRLAERRLAENLLERGQTLALEDEHGKALLAFARGLEVLPFEFTDLERVLRLNMGASLARQHQLLELFPQPDSVHGVVFSQDGKSLITGGHDNTARIWDIATGKVIELFHPNPVWNAVISPDGNLVATASGDGIGKPLRDGIAALWERHTGKELFTLKHTPKQTVWSVSFTKDGKRLLTGAEDHYVRLWNVKSGEKIQDLKPSDNTLEKHKAFRFAQHPDGKHLATVHGSKVVFWDLPENESQNAKETRTLLPHLKAKEVQGILFSANGRRFLTTCETADSERTFVAQVWDWPALTPCNGSISRNDRFASLRFSKDGSLVLLGSTDGEVLLFDAEGNRQLQPIKGPERAVFHPSEPFIVGSNSGGFVRMWDTTAGRQAGGPISIAGAIEGIDFDRTNQSLMAVVGSRTVGLWRLNFKTNDRLVVPHDDDIPAVAFHPSGKTFLTVARDKLRIWDTVTGKKLHELPCPDGISSAMYSREGDAILCACNDGGVVRWELEGNSAKQRNISKKPCAPAALDPDGKILAGVSRHQRNQIFIWDAATGNEIRTWQDGNEELVSLIFVNSDFLATTSTSGKVKLWNVHSGTLHSQLLASTAGMSCQLAVSGNQLACGLGDMTVQIIDWQTGAILGSPLRLAAGPVTLAFLDEGKILATSAGPVTLWDLATRRPLGPPLVNTNSVQCMAVSPDGRLLLLGGAHRNRTARLAAVPTPITVPREHIVLWSQVVTALEADDHGGVVRITADEWRRRRDELKALGVRLDD